MKTTSLEVLLKKKKWYWKNPDLNDKNFPNPKTIETEGFKVIKMDKYYSSQEALDRIKKEGLRPATVHELALYAVEHPESFPDGVWTGMVAFGSEFIDSGGDRRVPDVKRNSDGDWWFFLGDFSIVWDGDYCLLCVCDTKNSESVDIENNTDPLALAIETCKAAGLTVTRVY